MQVFEHSEHGSSDLCLTRSLLTLSKDDNGGTGDGGSGDGGTGGGETGGSGGDDPNSPNYISGFTYQGCYQATQDSGLRLLRGPNEQRVTDLTRESCESFCAGSTGAPFKYIGIEAGRDCRCSNTLSWDNPEDDASLCTSQLSGDPNHTAGGSNRISVWQNDAYTGVRQLSNTLLKSSMLCITFVLDPG
ncbi:hypothetical protein SLS60_000070 [Paraconiothyrium brasiliense]|uniref:WSC domain-containing protein n=1 Tax=Paraconiothyrium brasiliense TaxID=300254 RepID=A0ABR3S6E1_9PLEO